MYTLVILTAALSPGQVTIDRDVLTQPPAKAVGKQEGNAEARKEIRDQVLRSVGPEAMAFTKYYSDLGVGALQQCDASTGKKIVKLFNSGEWLKISNPRAVLEAIRQNGAAGAWAAEHYAKLIDPEACELWCKAPLEFVFELKDLEQAAEELRSSRKKIPSWITTSNGELNVPYLVFGGVVVLLLGVIIWQRKASASNCRSVTRAG